MGRHNNINGVEVPFTEAEEAIRDTEEAVWLANAPRRKAQKELEQYDAKGFTRAWESAMAPIEAEDDVGEYDANVLAEKRAARAVVVG